MGRFTEEEMKRIGLEKQADGSYKKRTGKPKKKVQPGDKSIWIPYNVPSSKNSKQIFRKKIKGKGVPFITDSKITKEYKKVTDMHYSALKYQFKKLAEGKDFPLVVETTFYRSSKRKWDFHNGVQVIADLMVEKGWIPDDDIDHVIFVPPLPPKKTYYYDKSNPGVKIRVL